VTGGASASAARHSTAGAAGPDHHSQAHGAHSSQAMLSTCGSSSSTGGGSNQLKLRQQVWQEVQAMRASGASGASVAINPSAQVTATLAAARRSAAELAASGGWGSHRHGSCSQWGTQCKTPPRPSSPQGTLLQPSGASPTNSRPTSPLLLLLPSVDGTSSAATPAAAAGPGGSPGASCSGSSSSVFKWGSGISLLSLTGALTCSLPSGKMACELGSAAAGLVASSNPRASMGVEKAVCFLTPRTQAHQQAAAAAAAAAPGQHVSHVLQVQQRPEGTRQHSLQPGVAAFAAPRYSSCSNAGSSGSEAGAYGAAQHQQQQQQSKSEQQQQQQQLVYAACKALGSAGAAEAYVATLPPGTDTVNFTATGRRSGFRV
jgi:hypothetical protein